MWVSENKINLEFEYKKSQRQGSNFTEIRDKLNSFRTVSIKKN